uniref:Interferon-induced GTP-binding protein Mx-like n=1 Tax=Astyanax mexicanus TaxID=7994 RepID=A0A8B9GP62_ASTMX
SFFFHASWHHVLLHQSYTLLLDNFIPLLLVQKFKQFNSKKLEEISNSLNQQYEEKVRPCIDLVDSLRSLGVEKDLSLPAIAVIGDQSSGKSSVLEALSGVALPRGTGIVTRCPLVLKLKRVETGVAWSGHISYQKKERVLSKPEDVGTAVSDAQNALAGNGKGISHDMITLEIKSSKVPDLTLIDLPGIARVATGDQPVDIEKQIKDLIEKFIKRQETISLVVVPANIDIATTEALKMASKVDPNGLRTLGILTKPDLVDKGAEDTVVSTVNNQVITLKKGYMMVKCRGQQDINANLSLAKALQKERDFFEQHPHFRPLLEDGRATVPLLAERLTKELVEHIGRSLPHLKQQIDLKLEVTEKKLKQLGDGVPQDENEKKSFLIQKINGFNQILTDVMRAEEDTSSGTKVFTKIRAEFTNWKSQLDKKTTTFEENLRDEVEEYSRVRRGKELPGFVNYRTFENIARKHIKELEEPALQLLTDVTEIVHSCLNKIANTHFEAYSNLLRAAKGPIEDLHEEEYEKAKEKIKSQFRMEKLVYSQDSLYSSKLESVKSKPEPKRFGFSYPMSADVREMAQHLSAYFVITTERLANQVPLIVQYHVLHWYISHLQTAMLAMIGEKNAVKLIEEDSDVARRRKTACERMDRLRQARQVLSKIH